MKALIRPSPPPSSLSRLLGGCAACVFFSHETICANLEERKACERHGWVFIQRVGQNRPDSPALCFLSAYLKFAYLPFASFLFSSFFAKDSAWVVGMNRAWRW